MYHFEFDEIRASVSIYAEVFHSLRCDGARALHTFSVSWNPEDAVADGHPQLILRWKKPIVDVQYQWHSGCGTDRTMHANWSRGVASKISSGSPLHCFYNDAGRNRYTVALDDCVTLIECSLGVREEDATLEMKLIIPLDATGKQNRYKITLWLDETDCRYEDAIRAVSCWWEEKYPPMSVPEKAKLPMYSCWYSFHQNVIAGEVEAECARAESLGMETVIVDDGWQTDDNSRGYAYCGDWQVTPGKIPDMRAHVEAVHNIGMKYMLWYSVPFIGKYSEAAKRFEGKTLEYLPHMNAYTLDPRYPDVRGYLIDIYVRALLDWNLDGFKLDFIDSFRMGEDTPGFREGMDYVLLEEAVHRLMVDVMRALTAIRPDVLIEFRQSYIGPVMREFGNMFRVGDCPNATSTNRVGMVDLRLTSGSTAVHSDMLVWHVEDRVENAVCQILNALFATVQISVRLDRVPASHVEAIRFWLKFMKQERALLQDAPIYAEAPQLLYPLVYTEADGRSIIACYERGRLVPVAASRLNEAVVVNANSGDRLVLDFDSVAQWEATICDCCGRIVRTEKISAVGLAAVSVPECGMICLKKL